MSGPAFEIPPDPAAALGGRPGVVRFLELAPVRAVMVDGEGAVGPDAFTPLMPGLYGTADGWTDLDRIFGEADRAGWRWTLLIPLPDEAADDELAAALAAGRGKVAPEVAPRIRLGSLDEGRVAQVLHVGPYAAERPTIERLHAAIEAAGLRPRGDHHEIYLGDPGRTAPERLRTLLRHPVEPA